jgi:hypothetical protein
MYLPVFQLEHSNLNLIVASTENNIVMVEGVAREVAEDILCDAVLFAHQEALKHVVYGAGQPWQQIAYCAAAMGVLYQHAASWLRLQDTGRSTVALKNCRHGWEGG